MGHQLEVLVIPGFHWDRAWYEGFQKFRIRLVDAMDKLLDILERREDYKFTLDGQTAILDDYLEIRPEKREALERYIAEGRLAVGPWYILPDENIPGGEAHIRNLLLGHSIAREFGRVMKVGYTPDAFGHISQLPQILNGFGIKSAFFTRGIPEGTYPTEFVWKSPDGSSVTAYHTNYGNTWLLGQSDAYSLDYLIETVEKLAGRSVTGIIAAMVNLDHLEPLEAVVDIVNDGRKRGMNMRIATIDELMESVLAVAPLKDVYAGECPPPEAHVRNDFLPGVLSTRTYLKQANSKAEGDMLLVEQLCTFAADMGHDYPAPLIRRAWRYVLQNQPHDDICGCSADIVHRDDMYRFEQAQEIAFGLIHGSIGDKNPRALEKIIGGIDTGGSSKDPVCFVVYNRLGFEVTGIVKATLPSDFQQKDFHVIDPEGNIIPHAVKSSGNVKLLEILVKDVPSCGYITYRIKDQPASKPELVTVNKRTMENKFLKVTIEGNGSLTILDKKTCEVYTGGNVFVEDEDAGDTYNHSRCLFHEEHKSTSFKPQIRLEEKTGLSATFTVQYMMMVPVSLTKDRKRREGRKTKMEVTSRITLEAESRIVRFETTIENTARDHRVSVRFPTGTKAGICYAEGNFDVVERPTELPEEVYPRFLVRNYVGVHAGERGVTVIPKGLCEYQATKNDKGLADIVLTLFRGVGYLGCNSLQASAPGPHIETPDAQCLGTQKFEYAFMPHTEDDFSNGECCKEAYSHNNDLRVYPMKECIEEPPKTFSFLQIPDGLILSSVKRGEEDFHRTYVRVWNPGTKPVEGDLTYFRDLRSAYKTGLDELRIEELPCKGNKVKISAKPKEILTVELVTK